MKHYENNEIDPDALLEAQLLADFIPFVKYYRIFSNELSQDYFLKLFSFSGLHEKSKIALSAVVIYNSDIFLTPEIGSIFSYFNYKLEDETYAYREELKFFVIHCLFLFLEHPEEEDMRLKILRILTPVISTDLLKDADNKMNQLVKKAFTSKKNGFHNKNRQLMELIHQRRAVPYSKLIINELFSLVLKLFPTSSIYLLELLSSVVYLSADARSQWITSLLDCTTVNPPPKKYINDFIQMLEDLSNYHRAEIRLSAYITAWLLTLNIKYLKRGARDNTIRVSKRCGSILKNPQGELKRRKRAKKKSETRILQLIDNHTQTTPYFHLSSESVIVFEVKYSRASRTIAIKGSQTLHDLHNAVQSAFEWDNDHLYAFFMNNRAWSKTQAYYSPEAGERPFANKKQLYTLRLVPQKEFLYLFDFGDSHHFSVFTKEITSQKDIPGPFPKLLRKKGKSPVQYPW